MTKRIIILTALCLSSGLLSGCGTMKEVTEYVAETCCVVTSL